MSSNLVSTLLDECYPALQPLTINIGECPVSHCINLEQSLSFNTTSLNSVKGVSAQRPLEVKSS